MTASIVKLQKGAISKAFRHISSLT